MGYIFLTRQATPLGFVTLITCLKTYKNATRQESLFRTNFKGIRVDEFGESGGSKAHKSSDRGSLILSALNLGNRANDLI
jgi:hypothetical protein